MQLFTIMNSQTDKDFLNLGITQKPKPKYIVLNFLQ